MRHITTSCVGLAAAFLCAAGLATALPGDRASTVAATMKSKGFAVTSNISELGGNRVYQAYEKFQGRKLGFFFQAGMGGRSFDEILTYDARGFSFARRSDPRVRGIITATYNGAIAADFAASKFVTVVPLFQSKDTTTFFKGAKLAYSVSGSDLTVFALKDLASTIATARDCATHECGD